MELRRHKKTLDLAYDFFVRGKSDVSRIPHTPYKTVLPAAAENDLARTIPEAKGVSSAHVADFLEELEHHSRIHLHALTVLVDGAVIAEAVAPGYDRAIPHVSHSMCKTVTGMAIGMLIAEGKLTLDTPAYTLFPADRLPARLSAKSKAITVRHLLTMSSGVAFAELGSAVETDWVRAFFSSDVRFEPGTDFAYNSMNTYLLSAIVGEVSGLPLDEYLAPRLLAPLRIKSFFWERCPMGVPKGGWGLYIAQEDAAKLGMMMLDGGRFEGKQILDASWIAEATATQKITPREAGDYNYGYQMWSARDGSAFTFNGMLGQNVWISPANRVVIVSNAGNAEFFSDGGLLTLFSKYFGAGLSRTSPLPRDRQALARLRRTQADFFRSRAWIDPLRAPHGLSRLWRRLCGRSLFPLPRLASRLAGRAFALPKSNSGILPTFMRLMQNNHTAGLRALSFEAEGDRFYACFDEGEGEQYRIPLGFYGYRSSILAVRGEVYRIQAAAAFAVNEDGCRVLKIEIVFPEFSHTRRIKVFLPDEDTVRLRLLELPDRQIVDGLFSVLPVTTPRTGAAVQFLKNRINLDYVLLKVYDKFEPELTGTLVTDEAKE